METHSRSWLLIVACVLVCDLLQARLFVTRDQKLAMRRDVGGSVYLLTTNDAAEQLTELSKHFNIKCVLNTLGASQRRQQGTISLRQLVACNRLLACMRPRSWNLILGGGNHLVAAA